MLNKIRELDVRNPQCSMCNKPIVPKDVICVIEDQSKVYAFHIVHHGIASILHYSAKVKTHMGDWLIKACRDVCCELSPEEALLVVKEELEESLKHICVCGYTMAQAELELQRISKVYEDYTIWDVICDHEMGCEKLYKLREDQ